MSELPAHVGLEPPVRLIETAGAKVVFTKTVIAFDVTTVGEAHGAFDVTIHVTT